VPARRVGVSQAIHDELARFANHLEHVCGLAEKTRASRRWWVARFLADRFGRGPIAVVTLAGPAQRRRRITPRQRIHQALQRGSQPRLVLLQIRAAGPGRRMRPGAAPSPTANSRRPFRIVSGASPVAADTNASPPYPMAIDSAAAQRRRARSLSTGAITTNFATIVASRSSSRVTRGLDHIYSCKHKIILGRGLSSELTGFMETEQGRRRCSPGLLPPF
jgi:hypothetical protein